MCVFWMQMRWFRGIEAMEIYQVQLSTRSLAQSATARRLCCRSLSLSSRSTFLYIYIGCAQSPLAHINILSTNQRNLKLFEVKHYVVVLKEHKKQTSHFFTISEISGTWYMPGVQIYLFYIIVRLYMLLLVNILFYGRIRIHAGARGYKPKRLQALYMP